METLTTMRSNYHVPVLCNAAIEGLDIQPDGKYIDVTFGGGGHSKEILSRLSEKGRLLVFDQDPDTKKNVPDDPRVIFVPTNFSYLKNFARLHGFMDADGILADLGVSSYQFDQGEKGFSIRFSGPLDMRMNPSQKLTAAMVVNEYEEEDLSKVLKFYGEIKNARRLASQIVAERSNKLFHTTDDLIAIVKSVGPKGKKENKYLAQVFQAIRIEVNGELEVLKKMLLQTNEVLKPNGRIVVISYHSLEDRLVKNYLKRGSFEGVLEKDFYGNVLKPFDEVTRKPMVPDESEIADNSRARSAKMRVAVKNGE